MNALQRKQAAFLLDTILYYNSRNRGIVLGNCSYRPGDGTKGCAIGRHISNKKLCTKLDRMPSSSIGNVFTLVPKKLQRLGLEFLRAMQLFHDNESNFTPDGLSSIGFSAAKRIQQNFNLTY